MKTGVHGWLSWLVVLHSVSRKTQHVLLCCHPRASGDPEVGCFAFNIAEGAARFTLMSSSRKRGSRGWLFCIQYRGRRNTFYSVVILAQAGIQRVVVLHLVSRKAQHVLLCCHPRASGDPEVGCFPFNIAEGAARFTLLSSSRKRGSRGGLSCIQYRGRRSTFVFWVSISAATVRPVGSP